MTLIPAYGRDYSSAEQVLKDWTNNKDFIVSTTGQYICLSDYILDAPGETVSIRYNKLRSKLVIGD